ncbi:MAG: phage tail fiber protein [Candidatus Limnocylindrus sp.]
MSKGNTFENDWMRLVFNATPIANLADNASASPLTSLYVSLHTADPGEGGAQSTSEATYAGYARIAVSRSVAGWTITNNAATNAADVVFGTCTSGADTLTHFAVGTDVSGSGKILYRGSLSGSVAVSSGIRPEFLSGSITISED